MLRLTLLALFSEQSSRVLCKPQLLGKECILKKIVNENSHLEVSPDWKMSRIGILEPNVRVRNNPCHKRNNPLLGDHVEIENFRAKCIDKK